MTFHCEEMQDNLPLQQAAEPFLHTIKHRSVSEDGAGQGCASPPGLSTHAVPTSTAARLFLGSVHPAGSARARQRGAAAPRARAGLAQEVTQLLSCTHLAICLLQRRRAVFSCLPAKSIFCSHSWEPYRWYRSLLPGVQSVFLLGCTLCL